MKDELARQQKEARDMCERIDEYEKLMENMMEDYETTILIMRC